MLQKQDQIFNLCPYKNLISVSCIPGRFNTLCATVIMADKNVKKKIIAKTHEDIIVLIYFKMSLSYLAECNDTIQLTNALIDELKESEFLQFAIHGDDLRVQLLQFEKKCRLLMQELQKANAERLDLMRKFQTSQEMLKLEQNRRRKAEAKVQLLENQLTNMHDVLWTRQIKQENKIQEYFTSDCKQESFLPFGTYSNDGQESKCNGKGISESSALLELVDSTGSLLSELGYTQSKDDLEWSVRHSKRLRKHPPSYTLASPERKKTRSNFIPFQAEQPSETNGFTEELKEDLVSMQMVTRIQEYSFSSKSIDRNLPQKTQILETLHQLSSRLQENSVSTMLLKPISKSKSEESVICLKESPDKLHCSSPRSYHSGLNIGWNKLNKRSHYFRHKTMVKAEVCEPCGKRIKFGKWASKCKECRAVVHTECRAKLPLPCVPASSTQIQKGQMRVIADYAPSVPPMIPALILHCVNEIEARGLKETGIYRISGSEREVRALKEKFLRGRGAPNLTEIDIHVICSVVKDFLRSLKEPLVMSSMWLDFVRCLEPFEEADQQAQLYQVISKLHQPNRDTLAFIILHLQRISECPECKMPASNLARVFGPTIVGYSCPNPEPSQIIRETTQQEDVMLLFMRTPSSYWACHVNSTQENSTTHAKVFNKLSESASSIQSTGSFFSSPSKVFSFHYKRKIFSHL